MFIFQHQYFYTSPHLGGDNWEVYTISDMQTTLSSLELLLLMVFLFTNDWFHKAQIVVCLKRKESQKFLGADNYAG